MTKRQYRRTVSLSKVQYERLREHCQRESKAMSSFVGELLDERLGPIELAPELVQEPATVDAVTSTYDFEF